MLQPGHNDGHLLSPMLASTARARATSAATAVWLITFCWQSGQLLVRQHAKAIVCQLKLGL